MKGVYIIDDKSFYHPGANMVRKQKITLRDVAEMADVSPAAAGNVINGGTGKIRVGAEARKRILEAARQLNYQPNMAASILRGGQSKLIGVFIDSFASYRTLRLLQEIERVCAGAGYRIITSFSHDNIVNMKEDYLMLQRYGVSGFLCCAHDYPDLKDQVAELFSGARDVVFMEKPCIPGMPYVQTSRRKALAEMIGGALRQGYRKFGVMHRFHTAISEQALRTDFMQALRDNGLTPDEDLIFEYPQNLPNDSKVRIRLAMEKMILPFRPDFLFIDDAVSAVTLRHLLAQTGTEIAIFGGNGDPLFADVDIPSLDPCYEKIASELLNLLLDPRKRSTAPVIEAVYRKGGKTE